MRFEASLSFASLLPHLLNKKTLSDCPPPQQLHRAVTVVSWIRALRGAGSGLEVKEHVLTVNVEQIQIIHDHIPRRTIAKTALPQNEKRTKHSEIRLPGGHLYGEIQPPEAVSPSSKHPSKDHRTPHRFNRRIRETKRPCSSLRARNPAARAQNAP